MMSLYPHGHSKFTVSDIYNLCLWVLLSSSKEQVVIQLSETGANIYTHGLAFLARLFLSLSISPLVLDLLLISQMTPILFFLGTDDCKCPLFWKALYLLPSLPTRHLHPVSYCPHPSTGSNGSLLESLPVLLPPPH